MNQKEHQLNTDNQSLGIMHDLISPTMVLFLMLGIMPLLESGFDHVIIYWLLLISTVLLTGYIVQGKKMLTLKPSNPTFWLILLLIWSFITIFWSINAVRSIIEWLQLFAFFLVFLLIHWISEEQLQKVIRIVFITGTGVALFGILEYLVTGKRIISTFPNSNPLGIYLAMLFLFSWGKVLHYDSERKPAGQILPIVSVILAVALILSGSRGSYLSMLCGLPFLFIGLPRHRLLKAIGKTAIYIGISLLLANGVMMIASVIQENTIGKSLFNSMTRLESLVPSSVTGRLEFWNVAIRLIPYNPLAGFGLGTYFSAYFIEYGGNEWYSRFAHNHYLQTAVETGLIGLMLFMSFLSVSAKRIIDRFRARSVSKIFPGALAASIAFLLHIGMDFSWNFPAASILFFCFLGITAGASKMSEIEEVPTVQNRSAVRSRKPIEIHLSHRVLISILLFVFLLTSWQYASLETYKIGMGYQEKEPQKYYNYIHFANKFYPLNSVGQYFESQWYYDIYQKTKSSDDLRKAVELAQRALSLAPYDAMLHNHLGKLYMEINDDEKAEFHLQQGTQYGAYVLSRYLDLAGFYYEQKQEVQAEEVLLKALDLVEYAVKRTPQGDKPIRLVEAAVIHNQLARIYESRKQTALVEYHKEEEQVFLKEAISFGKEDK